MRQKLKKKQKKLLNGFAASIQWLDKELKELWG